MQRTCSRLLIGLAFLAATAGAAEPVPGAGSELEVTDDATQNTDPSQGKVVGKVTETMDAGHYTYVQVETGGDRIWAAGPQTQVQVGDPVSLSHGTLMVDFFSSSLDRKFDRLYLVPTIGVAGSEMASHPAPESAAATPAEATGAPLIARAEGGHTVAEVFERKADLAGKKVAVRGQVVKFNSGIMGRNWIHLQDGTVAPDGATDLVVTTDAVAEVGSTVLVQGVVATDKDFGYGYQYVVLIEEAGVSAE